MYILCLTHLAALAFAQDEDPFFGSIAVAMSNYYQDHSTDIGIITAMQSFQSEIDAYVRTATLYSDEYSFYTAAFGAATNSDYISSVLAEISIATATDANLGLPTSIATVTSNGESASGSQPLLATGASADKTATPDTTAASGPVSSGTSPDASGSSGISSKAETTAAHSSSSSNSPSPGNSSSTANGAKKFTSCSSLTKVFGLLMLF